MVMYASWSLTGDSMIQLHSADTTVLVQQLSVGRKELITIIRVVRKRRFGASRKRKRLPFPIFPRVSAERNSQKGRKTHNELPPVVSLPFPSKKHWPRCSTEGSQSESFVSKLEKMRTNAIKLGFTQQTKRERYSLDKRALLDI
jgi:hypothetical protein